MMMDPVAAVLQPSDAFPPVAEQPDVHAMAADSIPFGDLDHQNPGADFQDGTVSLLSHAQLPQHERECQASSGAKVSSIKRDSTGILGSRLSPSMRQYGIRASDSCAWIS